VTTQVSGELIWPARVSLSALHRFGLIFAPSGFKWNKESGNMSQVIKQNVTLDARPSVIFEALMDSKKHSAFTGAPAKVSRKVGGEFSHHGGHIGGVNVDIIENKLIVQAWRPKGWAKGTWSLATFSLALVKGGKTKLSFTHQGVPAAQIKSITSGWKAHYSQPLKAAVLKRKKARVCA